MRISGIRLTGFALFGLLAPATAWGQMIPQRYIQTIDVQVLNTSSVVVGRIADVLADGPNNATVSIQPEQVLKGSRQDALKRDVKGYDRLRNINDVFGKKERVLVAGDEFIFLDAKELAVPTAKGTLIRTPDKVIDYAGEVLSSNPGVERVETFAVPIFQEWHSVSESFSSIPIATASWTPTPLVIVPVNTAERLVLRGRLARADQTKLSKAVHLKDLEFDLNAVTDSQLETIGHITTLTRLAIHGQISDSGLKHLQGLANLEELDLSLTGVTNSGVAEIAKLPRLSRLVLAETELSDDGLLALSHSRNLKTINVTLTRTTNDTIANIRKARPDLVIERSLDAPWIRPDQLAVHAFAGDIEAVRRDLAAGTVSGWDQWGNHALFYAVDQQYTEIVELLLDRLARVDIQNVWQNTALHWAAERGSTSMLKLLLDRGADVTRTDYKGNTVLHFAARNGSPDAIRLLLGAGASPSLRNKNGQTPRDIATKDAAKDLLN